MHRLLFVALLLATPARAGEPVPAGDPAGAGRAALVDAGRLPTLAVAHTRWLYLGHLPPEKRQVWWQVLSRHVNGLSLRPRIVRPPVVLADGSVRDGLSVPAALWPTALLLRVDTLAYGPRFERIWEKLPAVQFRVSVPVEEVTVVTETKRQYGTRYYSDGRGGSYGREEAYDVPVKREVRKVVQKNAAAPWLPVDNLVALEALTGSTRPVVYGDEFLWQTGQQSERDGHGYYDFKGIKTEADFHRIVGFDEKLFEEKFADFIQEVRFAQARSDVLKQGRLVKRFEAIGGAVWATYDNRKAQNVVVKGKAEFRDPRSIVREFTFDGTEQFGLQSNKLWATYAGNNKGEALDSAPDFLGGDALSNHNTKRIEVNISCLRCHKKGGLKNLKPYHQDLYRPPLALVSPDDKELARAQELYFAQLEPLLALDRARYAAAVAETNGLTTEADAEALGDAWAAYDGDVDLARACRELGTTPDEFRAAVRAYLSAPVPAGDMVLGNWLLAEPESLGVDSWHADYPAAQVALVSWRAMTEAGFRPDAGTVAQRDEWARTRGFVPCVEKGDKLYGRDEACRLAGFDWTRWRPTAPARKAG